MLVAFRIVSFKDVENGEVQVLYDAKKAISKLETPVLRNPKVLILLVGGSLILHILFQLNTSINPSIFPFTKDFLFLINRVLLCIVSGIGCDGISDGMG